VKVLHVASAASVFPRFRWQILEAIRAAGHTVEIACRDQPEFVAEIRAGGFPVHVLPLPRRIHPVRTVQGLVRLRRLIKDGAYDAVHLHQPMGALVGIPAARLAGQRTVLYTTGGLKANEAMHPFVRAAVAPLEWLLYSAVTAVLSVNREDVEEAIRAGIVPPDRIFFVGARGGCGIDTTRFRPPEPGEREEVRAGLGLDGFDGFVVGLVARTVWEKGFADLLEALRAWPGPLEIRLVVVGGGPDFEAILDRARALGVHERVSFLGERGDVPRLLRAFDAFVLPSWREGMPVALLEAMATGLPVVATAVRGSREVVEDGRNGLLVPARDPAALRAALARLAGDVALRDRLGAAAVAEVRERHAQDVVLPAFLALYERLLGNSGQQGPRHAVHGT